MARVTLEGDEALRSSRATIRLETELGDQMAEEVVSQMSHNRQRT
jgi:hypothetical protein